MKCSLEFHQSQVIDKNIVLIEQCSDPNFYKVKFKNCDHIEEKRLTSIKKFNSECSICKLSRFQTEAENFGLKLIGEAKTGKSNNCDYREYLKVDCGHSLILTLGSARSGNFRCKVCFNSEVSELCSNFNLEYVESCFGSKGKFLAKCKSCGSTGQYQYSNLRRRGVSCKQCKTGFWNSETYFYVFKITTEDYSWIKVGHSNNLYLRHVDYKIPVPYYCHVLFKLKFKNKSEAFDFEKIVHKNLIENQIDKEYMKKYMSNGYSECYSEESLDFILNTIERLLNGT